MTGLVPEFHLQDTGSAQPVAAVRLNPEGIKAACYRLLPDPSPRIVIRGDRPVPNTAT